MFKKKKNSQAYAAELGDEPELVLDEEVELPATPRGNAPNARLQTVVSGEPWGPEPEPEPEIEPLGSPQPEPEPDKEMWQGDVETVATKNKDNIKWQKKYAIVWRSFDALSWNPRMEIFANLKAARKGLNAESVIPLDRMEMEREDEDKFNTVQLAFRRADGFIMRMRMDDKQDASAPFQDAVLQAMATIPEEAEFDQASTPRRPRTAELHGILTRSRPPGSQAGSVENQTPPLTARSGGSVSSATSSLWQVYIEEDAATQIQRIVRGRTVRQDMMALEIELAVEAERVEQEVEMLALEDARQRETAALTGLEDARKALADAAEDAHGKLSAGESA